MVELSLKEMILLVRRHWQLHGDTEDIQIETVTEFGSAWSTRPS